MRRTLMWVGGILIGLVLFGGTAALIIAKLSPDQTAAGSGSPKAAGAENRLIGRANIQLGRFVTNLDSPGTAIDVSFVLVLTDVKHQEPLKLQEMFLRDVILGVVRSYGAEELRGTEGKDNLARAVLSAVQAVVGPDIVDRVLITDLVTQP